LNSSDAKMFSCVFVCCFFALKAEAELQVLKFELLDRATDKLAFNGQNFTQVGHQLKFDFRVWLFVFNKMFV